MRADERTRDISKNLAKVIVDEDMGIRDSMELKRTEWQNNKIEMRLIDFSFLVELEIQKLLK